MSIEKITYLIMVVRSISFLPSHNSTKVSERRSEDRTPIVSQLISLVEVTSLECPEPKIGDLLVVKFRIADVAVARDQDDMGPPRGSGIFCAHEHFALVF